MSFQILLCFRLNRQFCTGILKILFKDHILPVRLKYLCKRTNECEDGKPCLCSSTA